MTKNRLGKAALFLLPIFLTLSATDANAGHSGRHGHHSGHGGRHGRYLDITITPDKDEYQVGEAAVFDIGMKRHNRPARIRSDRIEATFPDVNTPATLIPLTIGNYTYATSPFAVPGGYTLSVTVRTRGAVRSKGRSGHKRVKDEAAIIGQAFCTVTVVTVAPDTPQLTDPGEVDEDGQYTLTWSDEIAGGATLYELQEDVTDTFTNPTTYRPTANSKEILRTEEGAYYYRVRAWTALPEEGGTSSNWSNTVDITVDFPFEPPPGGSDAGYIHGQVYDNSTDAPLPATRITIRDVEGAVLTNGEGRFIFPIVDYPPENKKTVIVTIEKAGYTYAQRRVTVTTTRDVSVDPAFLTPLDSRITVITSAGGTATNTTGTIEMIFPEGAVGQDIEVNATKYNRGKDLPHPLPESSFFTYAIDLRPDRATFSQPVTVKLANSRRFAPGTPIPVGYYNKEKVRWEAESMGEVTADGQWVEFEVTHFSPRDINLPVAAPAGTRGPGPDKIDNKEDTGQTKATRDPGVGIRSGTLLLERALPSTTALGRTQTLNFTYSSNSANPSAFIAIRTGGLTFPPETFGWMLDIEGIHREVKFTGTGEETRQGFLFNGKNARGITLPTGSYPYTLSLSNDYPAEYFTTSFFGGPPENPTGIQTDKLVSLVTKVKGEAIINNRQASPFGAGWTLNQLQRLHFASDGRILLIEGDGSSTIFTPTGLNVTPAPFLSDVQNPADLTIDEDDNLYLASACSSISKITPSGETSVYAAVPAAGLAFDETGNLYAGGNSGAGNYSIYRITPEGKIIEIGRGGLMRGVAVDKQGTPYIADNGRVVRITPHGKETFVKGFGYYPGDIAFDDAGNLYVSDRHSFPGDAGSDTIAKVTPDGEITTFASGFINPYGLAFDGSGNLYVSDEGDDVVYKITPEGEKSLFASGFAAPTGLVFDSLGNLFVSNNRDWTISKLTLTQGAAQYYTSSSGGYSYLAYHPDYNTYTRTLKDGARINFNSQGLHTSTVDRNGNTTTYAYDDVNGDGKAEEPVTITDPAGGVTRLTYDSRGYLSQITDSAGRTTQFNIDASGNLVSITTPDGATTQYTYDENHLIDNLTGPRGHTTQYEKNSYGRYTRIIFPTGEEINFTPSEMQGLINDIPEGVGAPDNPADPVPADIPDLLTNGRGYTTTYRTDKFGAPVREEDPLGNVTVTERDNDSNPVKITQPNGDIITFTYDDKGNPLTITREAIDAATTFTYNTFSQVTSTTDPEGNTTRYQYDAQGNLIKVIDAQNNETMMSYDSRGLLTTTTDPEGNTTQDEYDTRGNLIKTTDALNNETTFTYDAAGNVISSTDARGNTTGYSYDDLNRLLSITYPDQTRISYTYDANSNRTTVTDQNQNTTRYQYDDLNRPIQVEDARQGLTQYTYDANGNRTAVTDARGNTTLYTYNERDLLTQTTNPPDKVTGYTYDETGNRISTLDPNGNAINYGYDLLNRLTRITYPDTSTVSFTYDKAGKRLTMTDSQGTTTYTYDTLNRLIEVDGPEDNDTISYTYDKAGNRLNMTNQDNGVTGYGYDNLNHLVSLTDPRGNITTYAYDNLINLTRMVYPNNTEANYTFDNLNRLINLTNLAPAEIISSYTYDYDPAGMRTRATLDNRDYISYSYNVLNQLTTEKKRDRGGSLLYSYDYTFDEAGNRLTMTKDSLTTTYSYNQANQLLSSTDGITYIHDDNGNLTRKTDSTGTTTYTYDYENRLIAITYPDNATSEYTYDGAGKRIQAVENGEITKYLYDGLNVIIERDENNATVATYTRGLSYGGGIGGIVSRTTATGTNYYHYDGLGTVTDLTDSPGQVVQTYRYDAYGNRLSSTGSVTSPYQFSTKEYSAKSNLIYFGARYYDPKVGRWTQPDPLGMINGPNLYLYVNNNPINWMDPFGWNKEKYRVEMSGAGGGIGGYVEVGTFTLYDDDASTAYHYRYIAFGGGWEIGFSVQPEVGIAWGSSNPRDWARWGSAINVEGITAGASGAGGQYSFSKGNKMVTAGPHAGVKGGSAVYVSTYTWYIGQSKY